MQFIPHTIAHAFPAPEYLRMAGAGIDISSHSVRAVVLDARGHGTKLDAYHKMDLEDGVVFDGDIEKPDKLIEVLRTLRLREHIRFAHASLLERKSYLYQILLPKGVSDMRSAVEFSLEEHVPIPPNEMVFDYQVVRTVDAGTIVSVTAYAKRIVESYTNVFTKAGITLQSLEVESQAAARALLDVTKRDKTVLLVDFGKNTTRIAVADCGVASFSATIDVGGDAMTNAIMKHFSISQDEAEKIKNKEGFLENKKNKELYEALMLTLSVLRDELSKHISFWNTSDEDGVPRRAVQEVRIIGGNANLRGLPEFLSRSLDLPVTVGNPWINAFSLDEYIPRMPADESLQYATTIGLALRSYSHAW